MSELELLSHVADNHDFNLSYRTGGHKMFKIRNLLVVFGMLFYSVAFADVQVNIGINVPVYPRLVVVPGYPVYYAPQLESNYFFYDGLYWVFQDDNWYQSSWYNGPWWLVYPEDVPLFILRVPVRYYRLQPTFFFGWSTVSAPRWGEHWGRDWEQRRNGWDRWDRRAPHTPAPLPAYQRQYSGDRYPHQVAQQQELQKKSYRYEPRDPVVQQHYQKQEEQRAPAQQVNPPRESSQQKKQQAPQDSGARQKDKQRSAPNQQIATPKQSRSETARTQSPQQTRQGVEATRQQKTSQRSQSTQKSGVDVQRSSPASPEQVRQPAQDQEQQSQPRETQHEQKEPRSQNQDENEQSNHTSSERNQKQGQERGKDRNN